MVTKRFQNKYRTSIIYAKVHALRLLLLNYGIPQNILPNLIQQKWRNATEGENCIKYYYCNQELLSVIGRGKAHIPTTHAGGNFLPAQDVFFGCNSAVLPSYSKSSILKRIIGISLHVISDSLIRPKIKYTML